MWAPAQVNRPQFFNSNSDIEGSKTRQLHIGLNKPGYSLVNEDIQGTKPDCVKFKTKREPCNPLTPTYKLQAYTVVPPAPPKFIRDGMQVQDIDGAMPRVKKELETRDHYNVADIQGAQPKKAFQRRDEHKHDQIFNDVTAKKKMERKQPFNPQNPQYMVQNADGKYELYGDIDGASVPKPYVRMNATLMDPSLRSRDIHGNKPGSKNLGNFHTFERRDVRAVTNNLDISGSTPGTLVKGIKVPEGASKRVSNPLEPVYQLPGSLEKKTDDKADPWGEEGCSMTRAAYFARRPQTGKPVIAKPIAQNIVTDENNMN